MKCGSYLIDWRRLQESVILFIEDAMSCDDIDLVRSSLLHHLGRCHHVVYGHLVNDVIL